MTLTRSFRWPGPVATVLLVLALVPLVFRVAVMFAPAPSWPLPFEVVISVLFLGSLAPWGLLVEAARVEGAHAWRGSAAMLAGATLLFTWQLLPWRLVDVQSAAPVIATLRDVLMYAGIALAVVTVVRARGVRPGAPLTAWAVLLPVGATVALYANRHTFSLGPTAPSLAWLGMTPVVLTACLALRAIARLGWPHRVLTASAATLAFTGAAAVTFLSAASRAAFFAGVDSGEWTALAQAASWSALALQVGLLLAALALTIPPPAHSPGPSARPLEAGA